MCGLLGLAKGGRCLRAVTHEFISCAVDFSSVFLISSTAFVFPTSGGTSAPVYDPKVASMAFSIATKNQMCGLPLSSSEEFTTLSFYVLPESCTFITIALSLSRNSV